ncbi:MAG: hypothetical protein ABSA18_11870 [Dehalococcoidia bacterium]
MMKMLSASIARDRFAELRREALKGQEILIEDSKQLNSPLISIISTELLDSLTDSFVFAPKWEEDEDGSLTVSLDEIDVIGYGETREEAAEVLATAASEYTELYFSELSFYLSPMVNRLSHYPYLRRIARCSGDIAKVKKVLGV